MTWHALVISAAVIAAFTSPSYSQVISLECVGVKEWSIDKKPAKYADQIYKTKVNVYIKDAGDYTDAMSVIHVLRNGKEYWRGDQYSKSELHMMLTPKGGMVIQWVGTYDGDKSIHMIGDLTGPIDGWRYNETLYRGKVMEWWKQSTCIQQSRSASQ